VVQRDNKLTDAGGRMIAEGLKGNCSVTGVYLVSAGLLLVRLLLLTCVEQAGNEDMSDAVKREVCAITERNKNEPEQRRAEVADMVASIKQVLCRFCLCFA
jgi:hypothetical protein